MSPKPQTQPNPTSKDLGDAISAQQHRTDDVIAAVHLHFTDHLATINSKKDAQQQTMDTRDADLRKTMAEQHTELTKLIADSRAPRSIPALATSTVTTSTISSSGISSPIFRLNSTSIPITTISLNSPTRHTTQPIPSLGSTQSFPFLSTSTLAPTQPSSLYPTQIYPPFSTTLSSTPFSTPQHLTTFTQPVITTFVYPPPPPYPPPPYSSLGPTSTYPPSSFTYSPPIPTHSNHSPFISHAYSPQPSFNVSTAQPRNPKIEMNSFDGTDALDWLFEADQFFTFYNIALENRLQMASFYMKGEA